jgi:hypothetical protein
MSFDFEAPVVKAESPLVVVDAPEPTGDGWYWRENNGEDYVAWLQAEEANPKRPVHVPQKPWQGPLTAEEMVAKYNELAAAVLEAARSSSDYGTRTARFVCVGVRTPKGISRTLCVELPLTVEKLESINKEPDPRSLPHW